MLKILDFRLQVITSYLLSRDKNVNYWCQGKWLFYYYFFFTQKLILRINIPNFLKYMV